MVSQNRSLRLGAVIAPSAFVAIIAGLLSWLPSEIRVGLTVWILASLPIGALIGHCVLSEQKARIRPFPPPPVANETDQAGCLARSRLGDQ